MSGGFDINDFVGTGAAKRSRYEKRISELQDEGIVTNSIELAAPGAKPARWAINAMTPQISTPLADSSIATL